MDGGVNGLVTQKILPNLYKIEVPLPRNPLKALNAYVIKAENRNLIIDTGMNREECQRAMDFGLRELGVDLDKTDFFLTHMHADHSGLVGNLATSNSRIYCSQPDAAVLNNFTRSRDYWDKMRNFAYLNGFPEDESHEAIEKHPGYLFSPIGHLDFTIVHEGDSISIGDYHFQCVATPGHTRGHMCLYESAKKILVAGDHILGDITPNISQWSPQGSYLQEYLNSLDLVDQLDIDLALPGHRGLINDCKRRIQELKLHHQRRIDEVLAILTKGVQTAYQVASQMTWDMTYDSWDLFPVAQKWFATGEAIAHLKYLEEKGVIQREMKDQMFVFSRKS